MLFISKKYKIISNILCKLSHPPILVYSRPTSSIATSRVQSPNIIIIIKVAQLFSFMVLHLLSEELKDQDFKIL